MNHNKKPSKRFMNVFYIACVAVIFIGAVIPMDAAWAFADISMGGMTLINLPCCLVLSSFALKALKDYEAQEKQGKDPTFTASGIGIPEEEENYWR